MTATSTRPTAVEPHPRMPVWQSDLLVLAVLLLFTFAPVPGENHAPVTAVSSALVMLCAAVLPWRRRWPLDAETGGLGIHLPLRHTG